MKTFATKDLASSYLKKQREENQKIGLVPTMGALHQGHLSLIKQAKAENDIVVVSIFVNPTQFNNPEDLEKYPRTLKSDLEKLKSVACDVVFTPNASEMYAKSEVATVYNFEGLDKEMEGKFRDNHFNGVGTIVQKLFEILHPTRAYFGEKDFQQLQIIKKLVEITEINTEIIGCPIFREIDGLAMSSRNARLSETHRKSAPFIYQLLQKIKKMATKATTTDVENYVVESFEEHPNLELEYFTISSEQDLKPIHQFKESQKARAFIAVFAGDIRLIDNIELY